MSPLHRHILNVTQSGAHLGFAIGLAIASVAVYLPRDIWFALAGEPHAVKVLPAPPLLPEFTRLFPMYC